LNLSLDTSWSRSPTPTLPMSAAPGTGLHAAGPRPRTEAPANGRPAPAPASRTPARRHDAPARRGIFSSGSLRLVRPPVAMAMKLKSEGAPPPIDTEAGSSAAARVGTRSRTAGRGRGDRQWSEPRWSVVRRQQGRSGNKAAREDLRRPLAPAVSKERACCAGRPAAAGDETTEDGRSTLLTAA
jgi:hypothetical protein